MLLRAGAGLRYSFPHHGVLSMDAEWGNKTYPGVVAKPRFHKLLRFQRLQLPAEFKVACVCLLESAEECLPQDQVCVLNTPHVLRNSMHEAVSITWGYKRSKSSNPHTNPAQHLRIKERSCYPGRPPGACRNANGWLHFTDDGGAGRNPYFLWLILKEQKDTGIGNHWTFVQPSSALTPLGDLGGNPLISPSPFPLCEMRALDYDLSSLFLS